MHANVYHNMVTIMKPIAQLLAMPETLSRLPVPRGPEPDRVERLYRPPRLLRSPPRPLYFQSI